MKGTGMGISQNPIQIDALLREGESLGDLIGHEPQRQQVVALVSRLAEAIRELLWDRTQLLRERDQLIAERDGMAGRLTRGAIRGGAAASVRVPQLS
jgi:hypothetical protein